MDMAAAMGDEIARFLRESPANRHSDDSGPYFEDPLVGFASAEDPIFDEYKRIIGEFHLTPRELTEDAPGEGSFGGGTVICWVLPVAKETRVSNRKEDKLPSKRWAHTRDFGEKFNSELRRHVVAFLQERGHRAVAPMLSEKWQRIMDSPVGIASTWSERHAAYAAGLGTFSINDGLITSKGIAHRVGSVITDLLLPADERTYTDHRSNCLLCRGEECGICIDRCPADALSADGHDKQKCLQYVYGTALDAVRERYGVEASGCGMCQTKVPCESRIPRSKSDNG
jgi:epoxyqueuosine reductase QueG